MKKSQCKRICKKCGKIFFTSKARIKDKRGIFCSRQCHNIFQKGKLPWNTGKICPNLSLSKMGNKNPMWKGGFDKKLYDKIYFKRNKKKILKKRYLWKQKNPEKTKIYRERYKKRNIKYRKNNKEKIRKQWKKYYKRNKDKLKIYRKKYYKDNVRKICISARVYCLKNKEKISQKRKLYRINNKKKVKEQGRKYKIKLLPKTRIYEKKRRASDINYKLRKTLRSRLRKAVKRGQKSGSAVQDLGCTILELKTYLEKQFRKGMNWGNWSVRGWHIDHKIPLSSFDLTNREQFLKATHYTNLQPLWGIDNLIKGNRIIA